MPKFERYVALRYLWSAQGRSEGRRFLQVVTLIAVGGVTVGVSALLLSLAIVRGFSSEITDKIISFGSHVQVSKYIGESIEGAQNISSRLSQYPDIVLTSPVIQEFALLRRSAQEIDGVLINGVDAVSVSLHERIVEGRFGFEVDSLGRSGLVIGKQLSRLLGLKLGDTATAFSIRNQGGAALGSIHSLPKAKQFYISGIYETSFAKYDELYVYTDLGSARSLFKYEIDEVSHIDLFLTNSEHAEQIAISINEEIGFPLEARTVFQRFRQYFAWVKLQQTITPVVISLIVLVAAFNILGTLLMIMFEKTREIGVLGGMGASPVSIFKLFLLLGLMIGGVGVVIGELLALGLALIQKKYSIIPLPAESYYMDVAPIELNGLDFLIVGIVALFLCAVVASVPAYIASFIKPIQAIRFR